MDLMLKHLKTFEVVEILHKRMCRLNIQISVLFNARVKLTIFSIEFDRTPPSALTVETRYEKILNMFGDSGFFAKTIPELRKSLNDALNIKDRPSIINVIIAPTSDRKAQSFNWLTESKL